MRDPRRRWHHFVATIGILGPLAGLAAWLSGGGLTREAVAETATTQVSLPLWSLVAIVTCGAAITSLLLRLVAYLRDHPEMWRLGRPELKYQILDLTSVACDHSPGSRPNDATYNSYLTPRWSVQAITRERDRLIAESLLTVDRKGGGSAYTLTPEGHQWFLDVRFRRTGLPSYYKEFGDYGWRDSDVRNSPNPDSSRPPPGHFAD